MEIRQLHKPEYINKLVDLINAAYRGTGGNNRWTGEAHLVSGDRIDAKALNHAITSSESHLYVAFHQGVLIGCICSTEYPEYIEFGLYAIDPEHHGRGFGKALLEHVERLHQSRNKTFRVSVVSENSSLLQFYIKRGYTMLDERLPYPIEQNVGLPMVENLELCVLQKAN